MTETLTVKKTLTKTQCKAIYAEAYTAGKLAGDTVGVVPMIVGTPITPFGSDIDYTKKTYFVEGGVCGFAWVHIDPARGAFVNWCKANKRGGKSYYGGYDLREDGGYGQSLQRKEAFCGAFAEVLRKYGINAYAQSRMD